MKYLVNGQRTNDARLAGQAYLASVIAGHDTLRRYAKTGSTEIVLTTLISDLLNLSKGRAP